MEKMFSTLSGPTLLIFLTIAIYLFIVIIFFYARFKYKGGLVEQVINLIIWTVGFLLAADIAMFMIPVYGMIAALTVNTVFKIIAMMTLAVAGLKFFVR